MIIHISCSLALGKFIHLSDHFLLFGSQGINMDYDLSLDSNNSLGSSSEKLVGPPEGIPKSAEPMSFSFHYAHFERGDSQSHKGFESR